MFRYAFAALLAIMFAACAPEYGVENIPPEPTPEGDWSGGTDHGDAEDAGATLDADGCWFGAWEFYADHEIGVKTLPVFELASPSSITVSPGEEVSLQIVVSSYNDCGDLEINWLFFVVHDYVDAGSPEWLQQINNDAIDAYAGIDGIEFDPYAADNMYVTPGGNELHYVWQDGVMESDIYPVNMPTVPVGAFREEVITFTWSASNYVPPGSTLTLELNNYRWTDITTMSEIDRTSQGIQDLKVTVHVE